MQDPDFKGRWSALGRGEQLPAFDASKTPAHFFKPLALAADEYVYWAQNPDERIYLGFLT